MPGIETYKKSLGAKVLKRLMIGKPVPPEDIQAGIADAHYGLIVVQALMSDKPKDIDEWDALVKRILTYQADGRAKYEALAAVDPNQDIHSEAKDRWGQPFTLEDAYEDRPAIEYLVKGVFPAGSLSVVYGAPGSMKSLIMAAMVIDVVRGGKWLERPNAAGSGFQTVAKPCMWLDFDNGKNRTHERFKAFGQALKVPKDAPLFYYSMAWPTLDASDPVHIGETVERIRANNISMVVIDNLGIISGGRDENTSQMQEVVTGLRRLTDETGVATIVLHHSRKSSGFGGRSGDAMRGHSSIEAGLDLALLVVREDQSDLIEMKATKVRGAPIQPFSAQFSYEHKPDTDELASARFWGVEMLDTTSDKVIKKTIIDVVSTGNIDDGSPLNRSQLIAQVVSALPEVGNNRIRNLIDLLVTSKEINQTKGKKNSMLITLPDPAPGGAAEDDD